MTDRAESSNLLSDEINDLRGFDAAKRLNTIDAYQSYIDAFPKGSKVAAALEAIDDLTLRPGKTFTDCADCPTMVVVPSGSFWQGALTTRTRWLLGGSATQPGRKRAPRVL